MKIIQTGELRQEHTKIMDNNKALWIYCGIDSMVTAECYEQLEPTLDSDTIGVYNFERQMLIPAMDMMLHGIRVNPWERSDALIDLEKQRNRLHHWLQLMAEAVWGKGLNPSSPAQLKEFFYEAMGLEKQYQKGASGEQQLTANRSALEALEIYFYARPIISTILTIKDLDGQLKVLRSGVDSDGRMRTSFNPSATETGRWSSSKNVFGGGTNFQNITPRMRKILIADKNTIMGYFDFEQAESRVVAYLSGDKAYIEACESGDLHTTTARMIWPKLPWEGDLKKDKKVANRIFYREFSFRDMSKRGGHASNYLGSAFQVAKHLKVPMKLIEEFQELYFGTFPGIARWHTSTIGELQSKGFLTTPYGRKRIFFGRLNAKETHKEAIAYVPQSTIGDHTNHALWEVWKYMTPGSPYFRAAGWAKPVNQVHDAILVLMPFFGSVDELKSICSKVLMNMTFPITINGTTVIIPVDCKVGFSWGDMYPLYESEKILAAHEKHLELENPLKMLMSSTVG